MIREVAGDLPLFFIGPPLEAGPLPAFFYFALSASESLSLDPICTPVRLLSGKPIRLFSLTLPFHEGTLNPNQAIAKWYEDPEKLLPFLSKAEKTIGAVRSSISQLALSGLSRGGFIALHLASRLLPEATIAFAPLTRLGSLQTPAIESPAFLSIGNRDTRVSTRSCFEYVESCVTNKKLDATLHIYPSVGAEGHGTPPEIFEMGIKWLEKRWTCLS